MCNKVHLVLTLKNYYYYYVFQYLYL